MAQLSNQALLKSVVKLVEESDLNSLDQSLLNTVSQLVSARQIKFGQIHENPDIRGQKIVRFIYPSNDGNQSQPSETIALLEHEKALSKCLESKQTYISQSKNGEKDIIHPVYGAAGITGFLILEDAEVEAKDQDLVIILLSFYKNYVSLLNDNQRDKLTNLLNRKTFDERMLKIIAAQQSAQRRVSDTKLGYCLGIIDIDHFKSVNDKFGHLYGDEVLLLFSQLMKESFRESDLLFRIGGEEFVVVLQDANLDVAKTVFERFRKKVADFAFPQIGKISASMGISQIAATDLPATIIDRADQALYYAKNNGRNQICVYENLVSENKLAQSQDKNDVELF
jgi:diguanylate cyclase (GGDEF)-like protein